MPGEHTSALAFRLSLRLREAGAIRSAAMLTAAKLRTVHLRHYALVPVAGLIVYY